MPTGGDSKGNGKEKDGEPQVCFKWHHPSANVTVKATHGTCQYHHPNNQKGVDKGKDGGKHSKQRSGMPAVRLARARTKVDAGADPFTR